MTKVEKTTTSVFTTSIPDGLSLTSILPNPVKDFASITFDLPASGSVILQVRDLMGKKVATILNNQKQPQGQYTVVWNGLGNSGVKIPSGTYLATLIFDQKYVISKRMLLLK